MDQQTKTAIIAAAFSAAGPIATGEDVDPAQAAAEHRARVTEAIYQITVTATDEKSWANKAINQVAGPDVKMFTGTVLKVTKEEKTTRGIVKLKTKFHPEVAPEGTEEVRTERTDDPVGLAMARRLRSLKGHRVLVWVEVEKFTTKAGTSRKMRVIRHCEDLGLAADDDEESHRAA